MKNLILGLIFLSIFSCTSTEQPEPKTTPVGSTTTTNPSSGSTNTSGNTNTTGNTSTAPDFSKMKKSYESSFVSGAHTTSGKVAIYEASAAERYVVFDMVKGDAGPDLRLNLASDLKNTAAVEISKTVEYGSVFYSIPKDLDLKKNNHLLIWCKQFSVLFGSATLK
jgi:hypothetical protein